jgi:hypothetical protein
MTQDIIEMAREAGCGHEALDLHWVCPENLEDFTKLVAAKYEQKIQDLEDMITELQERQA